MNISNFPEGIGAFASKLRVFQKLLRFGAVGGVSTVVHGAVLTALVETADVHPTLANIAAFIAAFLTSYFGHYYITFKSTRRHLESAPRYLAVALAGLANNTFIFLLMVNGLKVHYGFAFALAIVSTPILVFALSQRFVYGANETSPPDEMIVALKTRLLEFSPAIIFFVIAAAYTLTYYYRAPFMDQWDFVSLYMEMEQGNLGIRDILAVHGAHFHTGAYVVMLLLGKLTGMNHAAEVTASLLVSIVGFVGLVKILYRAADQYNYERSRAWLIGFAALFWWALDQATNLIWGWQVAVYLNTAGAVWCVYWLTSPQLDWPRLVGAAIASTVAILSFGTGVALAPLGVAILLARRFLAPDASMRRHSLAFLAGWLVISAAQGGVVIHANYFSGATYASETIANPLNWGVIAGLLVFIQNFLANPVIHFSTEAAAPVFLISVGVLGYIVWRNARTAPGLWGMTPLLALAAYGVGSAALTAIGRIGDFGVGQAFVSRYINFGDFYWIGLISLLALVYRRAPSTPRENRAALIYFVILVTLKIATVANITTQLQKHAQTSREAARTIVETWPETDEAALQRFAAPHQDVDDELNFIATHKLSVFRYPPK